MTPRPRPRRSLLALPLLALALCILSAALWPRPARAVDYNFAGSVSLNYKTLVNELDNSNARDQRTLMMPGFNVNAAVKAVVDVSPYLSASVKMCYGCHGLEIIGFVAELTSHRAFNVRVGRFQPSFGDFYMRHDPTIHKTPDNPLPYDMGHMVRLREWNMGVLPVPYSDNGAEAYGTLRFSDNLSLSYAAHVVSGWKGADTSAATAAPNQDFAYRRMRFVTANDYLVDNNRWPSFGGRAALTFARGRAMSAAIPDITLGGSAMYGTYDDEDRLRYLFLGADIYVHLWRINLRAEVLRRQMDIDPRQSQLEDGTVVGSLNKNGVGPPVYRKDGFYVESDFPLGRFLEGVLRWDGMRRSGAKPSRTDPDRPPASYTAPAAAVLDQEDWILRYTVGLNVIPLTGVKIKLAYELWTFKNVDDPYRLTAALPFHNEHMVHIAAVAGF